VIHTSALRFAHYASAPIEASDSATRSVERHPFSAVRWHLTQCNTAGAQRTSSVIIYNAYHSDKKGRLFIPNLRERSDCQGSFVGAPVLRLGCREKRRLHFAVQMRESVVLHHLGRRSSAYVACADHFGLSVQSAFRTRATARASGLWHCVARWRPYEWQPSHGPSLSSGTSAHVCRACSG
jgi:hypothetical protein